MIKKVCPYSKIEFIPKRSNQIFLNKDCRIKYNNAKSNFIRHQLHAYNGPLLKNYKILEEIMRGKKEKTFHKEFLKGKDFSSSLITHNVKGEIYDLIGVYKYTIDFIPNSDNVKIRRND